MARIKAVTAKEVAAKAEAAKAEVEATPALVCPRAAERAKAEAEAAAKKGPRSPLNEVSVMSEFDKKRQGYLDADV